MTTEGGEGVGFPCPHTTIKEYCHFRSSEEGTIQVRCEVAKRCFLMMMICKHTFKRLTNENPFNILLKPRGKQSLFTLKLPEHIHPQGLPVLLGQGVFTNHKPFVSISHSQLGEAVKREVTLVFHTSLTGLFRPALERAFPSVA